jgi:hypothetical protein
VKLKKFNLNSYVYFRPTALGLKLYDDYYKNRGWAHKLQVDAEGFAKLQWHNFVDVYGEQLTHVYRDADKPFETYEVYFDEESLIRTTKYDWTHVDEEVEFLTTDSDGKVKGFQSSPHKFVALNNTGRWQSNSEYYILKKIAACAGDWQQSLEARPK